jgi:hypothetical protein
MFTTEGLRSSKALVAKNASSLSTSGASAGADDGHGRAEQGVEAADRRLHGSNPGTAGVVQVDVFGRGHTLPAPDACRTRGS